jgi:hypothetical protein
MWLRGSNLNTSTLVRLPCARACDGLRLGPRHRPVLAARASASAAASDPSSVEGLPEFLKSLKYDDEGLVTVIVQVLRLAKDAMHQWHALRGASHLPSQARPDVIFQDVWRYTDGIVCPRTWTPGKSPCKRLLTRLPWRRHCKLA